MLGRQVRDGRRTVMGVLDVLRRHLVSMLARRSRIRRGVIALSLDLGLSLSLSLRLSFPFP